MKKLKKKLLIIVPCIIILCIIGYVIIYNSTYSISDNNKAEIQNALMKSINTPTVITKNLEIKQSVNIDNKKYVIYMNTNVIGNSKFLGDGELVKGRNNKYKVNLAGYAGQSTYLQNKIVETNKGNYLIVYGENYNKRISYATVKLMNDRDYYVKIPNQEYFIAYCSVPKEVKAEFPYSKEMKLYDKYNKDITKEINDVIGKINGTTID